MWPYRQKSEKLTPEEKSQLDELFELIAGLDLPYYFRLGLMEVFDTAANREEAASRLEEFRALLDPEDSDSQVLLKFFGTYDAHRDGILAYFDARKTSGPIEGLNHLTRPV